MISKRKPGDQCAHVNIKPVRTILQQKPVVGRYQFIIRDMTSIAALTVGETDRSTLGLCF